jgi:glutamate/tyrosine decarboxylase-like PLP-dependent enzyme
LIAEASNLSDFGQRQLGTGSGAPLDNLAVVVEEWLKPFLKAWMCDGAQPVPGPDELSEVRALIDSLAAGRTLPEGYSWLPELLGRLAENKRFNRRNFVNIHPSPHVSAILAGTVVALQNPNNIVEEVSGPTSELERQCVEWLAVNLLRFKPGTAWGNVVSCGTVANMTALLVARDYCYRKLARPRPAAVRARGLFDLPSGIILTTASSHYSIRKAAWFLGIGDENVVEVPVAYHEEVLAREDRDLAFVRGITDRSWSRLINEAWEKDRDRGRRELAKFYAGESRPFSLQPLDSEIYKALYSCFEYGTPLIAYVFTLGTTDTGTIERPDGEALRRLVEEDVYIHADAAAGGFALMHPDLRPRLADLGQVHSATIDGHKLGHLAYPCGSIVFRERAWLHEILHEAPYLKHLAPTLEGSRPGSHIASLWAALRDLGDSGRYVAWLDLMFKFVKALVDRFETSEFQVLHEVHLTTVAVAPRLVPGQRRSEGNRLVVALHRLIAGDTSAAAFLVNIDRGLCGIKVRDSNRPAGHDEEDSFEDIYCLRIVVTNPAVTVEDAGKLVEYLEEKLLEVRAGLHSPGQATPSG